MPRPEKVRLGEILLQQQLLTEQQLQDALAEQKRSGRKLGRVFVEKGFVSEEQISTALAKQLQVPYVNLKHFTVKPEVAMRLPETQARRFRALVLEDAGAYYRVAMADPTDLFAYDEVSRSLKREIQLAVVTESLLLQTVDRVYRRTEEISGLAEELGQELGEAGVDFAALGISTAVEDAPVVRLLQSVFEDAVGVRASDIHIEPQETRLIIRFRIDGVLHVQTEADPKIASALVLRLKLMSGLDISEKRLPQDGRFNVKVRNAQIDVRISTMPVHYGESVVMRLLNQSTGLLTLDRLGMPSGILARVRDVIHRPSGMILVTGPTGSGKTTTL
jgi:MSHA biogenesis protein MshE